MVDPVIAAGLAPQAAAHAAGLKPGAASGQAAAHHRSFREFLSELNPLQYIPVIGTLYRSITGDRIPEVARDVGSMVFSGLTGGPVGVAINVASLAVEKAVGIDAEKLGARALAAIGIGDPAPARMGVQQASVTSPLPPASAHPAGAPREIPAPTVAIARMPIPDPANDGAAESTTTSSADAAHAVVAWSPAQLTAYGITTTTAGDIVRGALQGSDVLNELELGRHRQVETA